VPISARCVFELRPPSQFKAVTLEEQITFTHPRFKTQFLAHLEISATRMNVVFFSDYMQPLLSLEWDGFQLKQWQQTGVRLPLDARFVLADIQLAQLMPSMPTFLDKQGLCRVVDFTTGPLNPVFKIEDDKHHPVIKISAVVNPAMQQSFLKYEHLERGYLIEIEQKPSF